MPLRIGFDLDGTLADFDTAFQAVSVFLFGEDEHLEAGKPEQESEEPPAEEKGDRRKDDDRRGKRQPSAHGRRKRDRVWNAIRKTPDFWNTLAPLDPEAVRRIHAMTLRHKWEVFFITQRPYTDGDTVQRQSQRWLVAQGFDMPSVLVISGSRGAAANALRLDYHVDDSPQNCLDVSAESSAKAILIVPDDDDVMIRQARRLKIATVPRIGLALDILEQATLAKSHPKLLDRLAAMVGWKS